MTVPNINLNVDLKSRRYDPGTVMVERLGKSWYMAYKLDKQNKKAPIHVPSCYSARGAEDWAKHLDDSQLEAAVQMYFDRWTFDTGNAWDRECFDVLQEERLRRQQRS